MAANDVDLNFFNMSEAEVRHWVEANPGGVNDKDKRGDTPLTTAVRFLKSAPLVLWLVKERGADLNAADGDGGKPLHLVQSIDVLDALSECDVDPSLPDMRGMTALIYHITSYNASEPA